jgi:predicted secreted protein
MTQEPTRTFDQAMVSVWEDELKATRDPSLKQQLSYREDDLLPRLAAPYQQLKALRRRVRRSSQRKWRQSLAGIALLRALGQGPALAATLNLRGAFADHWPNSRRDPRQKPFRRSPRHE